MKYDFIVGLNILKCGNKIINDFNEKIIVAENIMKSMNFVSLEKMKIITELNILWIFQKGLSLVKWLPGVSKLHCNPYRLSSSERESNSPFASMILFIK